MAKPELGTKRVDPETGRKFYDLNQDPIISPYTGRSYPRSYFETTIDERLEEENEEEELDTTEDQPEFVTLEEADDEVKGDDDLPDLGDDDDDVDLGDDDDPFLSTDDEDEDDDDVSGILGGGPGVGDDDEN